MKAACEQQRYDSLPTEALGRRILIQRTDLAGLRHHQAPRLWDALRRDAPLTLERDATNPYDPDAVAVHWKGLKLGYLPRGGNFMVARLLDGKRTVSAKIEVLSRSAVPNRRIRVAVLMH